MFFHVYILRKIILKKNFTISFGLMLGMILTAQYYTVEPNIDDRSRPSPAAHNPADPGPPLPLSAATKQQHPKISSSIQNVIEDEAVVISPVTRSQLADFEGYSESGGQTNRSTQPRISEQDPSTDAGFLGIDNSEPYPNWEPSSDQYLIESTAHGADIVDKYENGNTYEGWQPINRVETGFAAQAGYE